MGPSSTICGKITMANHHSALTLGARILRGFQRIGAVFAATAIIIGVTTSYFTSTNHADYSQREYAQMLCVHRQMAAKAPLPFSRHDKNHIDLDASDCRGPRMGMFLHEIPPTPKPRPSYSEDFRSSFAIGLGYTAATASAMFATFWAIGWILAGFTRD